MVGQKSLGGGTSGDGSLLANDDNAILDASDAEMKQFAQEELGCKPSKGLDFVARFNGKYVIGRLNL